jgi:hypothetical protein
MGVGPPKVTKNSFRPATTVSGSAALPFVISTGAKRSGEISGFSGPILAVFSLPSEAAVPPPPHSQGQVKIN